MYGTASELPDTLAAKCNFSCYKTYDFENFEGHFVLFDAEKENFWADRDFWAAEMHKCKYDFDGGHAMILNTLEGKRMISLHRPNTANLERAFFCEY